MSEPSLRDRVLGCLLGGAVGDALGAPFEGLWGETIPPEDELLAGFAEFEGYPRGQFTDDTQLTIATVESIVETGHIDLAHIASSIAGLWKTESVVGPGGACTRAAHAFLRTGDWQTSGAPIGQAGNGTAMRTAALGLYFINEPDELPAVVADVSRITHQDPRSVAGGVAIAKAAQLLAARTAQDPSAFCGDVAEAMRPYEPDFADLVANLPARLAEPEAEALPRIAWAGMARPEFERPIITPFVIPTVLACLWTVLRHPDSWGQAVASVIRLGGDVDTTGSIVGALLGARLGIDAIPAHLVDSVLDSKRLRVLADRDHALIATGR